MSDRCRQIAFAILSMIIVGLELLFATKVLMVVGRVGVALRGFKVWMCEAMACHVCEPESSESERALKARWDCHLKRVHSWWNPVPPDSCWCEKSVFLSGLALFAGENDLLVTRRFVVCSV